MFWKWITENKDAISSLATIIQAIAVVLGVATAINEFVIKDRIGKRESIERTIQLAERIDHLHGELIKVTPWDKILTPDQWTIDEFNKFVGPYTDIQRTFKQVSGCISTQLCNEQMLRTLVCSTTHAFANMAYSTFYGEKRFKVDEGLLENDRELFEFVVECEFSIASNVVEPDEFYPQWIKKYEANRKKAEESLFQHGKEKQ